MKPALKSYPLRIYLVALVIRLIPVFLTADFGIGLDDMFQYDMLARSLAAGQGYRWYAAEDLALIERYFPLDFFKGDYDPRGVLTSFRPPGYPFFLAVVYFIGGLEKRFFIARLVQAFVGASLAPLTYALTRRLFPEHEKAAKLAAVALAVYPFLVVYCLGLATENTFVPLLLGAAVMLLKAGETHRMRDYALAGALLGMASLTRSVVTAIIPFTMLWAWFYAKDKKAALVIPACVLVFTAPWSIRNTLLHGKFYYIESALGYDLHQGYHPEGLGTFQYGISLELMPYMDDAERDEIGMALALGYIRDDPGRVPELMIRKLGYFFELERRAFTYFYGNNLVGYIPQPWFTLVFLIFTLPFVAVTCSAAMALPFLPWKKNTILVGMMMFGYITPHILILAEPRFHLAMVPFFAALAGYTWANWRTMLVQARTRKGRWLFVLGCVLVALLFLNWGLGLWRDADKLAQLFGPEGNVAHFPY
jgi:hypothetical protein